jgi:hypothetical protein
MPNKTYLYFSRLPNKTAFTDFTQYKNNGITMTTGGETVRWQNNWVTAKITIIKIIMAAYSYKQRM